VSTDKTDLLRVLVSRRALASIAALSFAVLAGVVWWFGTPRGPRVVEQGTPLPFDQPVEMRFHNEETGETETWKLEKKTTTREEALGTVQLPEPDPAGKGHAPDESARTLDGLALEAWKSGDIEGAMQRFEAAIAADPDDRVPRSHYGRLLTLMTDYDAARPHLERAAALAPEDPQVWLDLRSFYERTLLLDQSWEARARAEALAGGRAITQDEMGLYQVEGAASFP
jgi:tetratricopeptide (TPR) repeat protein